MERNNPSASYGYTVVLETPASSDSGGGYHDTSLPPAGRPYPPAPGTVRVPQPEPVPERISRLLGMFDYRSNLMDETAAGFLRQARFMEDYEDNAPWPGGLFRYYPTYQEMTVAQLRGYFSWRADVRRGIYRPISTSAAYVYIYELLNGVGASSPGDVIRKMQSFEAGYIDIGFGDTRMRQNLRRWMFDFTVIKDLPPELARSCADPALLRADEALAALRYPAEHTDEAVFSALCLYGGQKLSKSPVLEADAVRGMRLFGDTWRNAAARYRYRDKGLFTLCFGTRYARAWHPLGNAVYAAKNGGPDRDFKLSETRTYRLRDGRWREIGYNRDPVDRDRLRALLHEAERLFRPYLKAGRALREKPEEAWATPYAAAAIEKDRRMVLEASRPVVKIDFSGLDRIRRDAVTTRDSLLMPEELSVPAETQAADHRGNESKHPLTGVLPDTQNPASADISPDAQNPAAADISPDTAQSADIPLDAVQTQILRLLLRGESPRILLRENHLLPSIAADAINDALYDTLGDIAVSCDGDELSLVEDYTKDIAQLLGGTQP